MDSESSVLIAKDSVQIFLFSKLRVRPSHPILIHCLHMLEITSLYILVEDWQGPISDDISRAKSYTKLLSQIQIHDDTFS